MPPTSLDRKITGGWDRPGAAAGASTVELPTPAGPAAPSCPPRQHVSIGTRTGLTAPVLALAVSLLGLLTMAPGASAQPAEPGTAQTGSLIIGEPGGEASVVADRIQQIGPDNLLLAVGNVEITRGTSRLLADRAELNRETGEVVAQGKVVFFDGPDRLVGDRIDYNLKSGTGVVYNGRSVSPPYYHLSGERMDRIGDGIYQIRRGTFTTCEGDDPPWSFRFSSGTADLEEAAYGRDVSFWVKSIPVMPWLPFFATALRRERQTGFLFPEFGNSSRKGFFARVPFYWAISDSQDLTVTPAVFSKTGVGGEAEYRYILSRDQKGRLSAFGINEAFRDLNEPSGVHQNRGWLSGLHDWNITQRLSFKIDSNVTSDDLVYRDYSDSIEARARQFAETNVFVSQRWDAWSLLGNVRWYQDLTTLAPVELQRVPDLRLAGMRQPVPGLPSLPIPGQPALLYQMDSSFVNFFRYRGPEGLRVDFHPRTYLPIPVAGLFTFTPWVGGRLTYYDQKVTGTRVTEGITIQTSVYDPRLRQQVEWGAEVESRLSRVYMLDGFAGMSALQHIFEPRAVVTEIRGINQKKLPTYDQGANTTTGVDPGYDRRVGIDSIGKANEVTYYFTNRLNGKTVAGPGQEPIRWELARFTLSQTYNINPVSQPVDDLFADLYVAPTQRIWAQAGARYNVYGLGVREINADVGVTYPRITASVGPRINDQAGQRFISASATTRVLPNVDVQTSTNWDITNGSNLETRAGFDWRFDCWAVRVEYVHTKDSGSEFRFSVNLLGLGDLGTKSAIGGSRGSTSQ